LRIDSRINSRLAAQARAKTSLLGGVGNVEKRNSITPRAARRARRTAVNFRRANCENELSIEPRVSCYDSLPKLIFHNGKNHKTQA
jgi:hypothetical protein